MKLYLVLLLSLIMAGCDIRYSEHKMGPTQMIDKQSQEYWLAYLDRKIKSSPKKSDNYHRKAKILVSQGEEEEAIILMKKAISLDPDNLAYRYFMADLYLKSANYPESLNQAKFVESFGMSAPGLDLVLGAAYFNLGNLSNAEEYLSKALSKDPSNEQTQLYMGLLTMAKGDTLLAEEAILKSLDLRPSSGAINALIDVSIFKKDYSKAFSFLNEELREDSTNQELLFRKAGLYQKTGKADSAKIILHQLIAMNPQQPDYYQMISNLHLNAYKYDSAIFYQNKVLEIDQNNKEALLTLARIHDRRGYLSLSMDFYKQIIEQDSTFQVAKDEFLKVSNKLAYLQRVRRERENREEIQQLQPKSISPPQIQ